MTGHTPLRIMVGDAQFGFGPGTAIHLLSGHSFDQLSRTVNSYAPRKSICVDLRNLRFNLPEPSHLWSPAAHDRFRSVSRLDLQLRVGLQSDLGGEGNAVRDVIRRVLAQQQRSGLL